MFDSLYPFEIHKNYLPYSKHACFVCFSSHIFGCGRNREIWEKPGPCFFNNSAMPHGLPLEAGLKLWWHPILRPEAPRLPEAGMSLLCRVVVVKITMDPQNLHILEVSMVNNLVFRWPKPLFFMVLGAYGIYTWKTQQNHTPSFYCFQGWWNKAWYTKTVQMDFNQIQDQIWIQAVLLKKKCPRLFTSKIDVTSSMLS